MYTDYINLVKKLEGDDGVITYNVKDTMTVKQLREYESMFNGNNSNVSHNIILFYDDTIQYTTLGLIDLLLDEFNVENPEWDYDDYFYRGFENSYYVNFVIKLFKDNFQIDLEEDYIKKFFKQNYSKILYRSPASCLLPSIIRCSQIYRGITICFRYNFEGIEGFCLSLKTDHFHIKDRFDVRYATFENRGTETEYLHENGEDFDIIIAQNLGRALDYVEDKEKPNLVLMGPNIHNGINPDYLNSFRSLFNSTTKGPYNSEFVIYNEGIAVC